MLLLIGTSARAQTPVEDGFRDFSYGTTVTAAVTGEKAESKLWWADGAWWGCLFSPAANRYRIHRFNPSTQSWTDAGTSLDDRMNAKADVLWDAAGQQLYVVSHAFSTSPKASSSSSNWARLYRFSYSAASSQYTLDSGFPVNVTRGTAEVLTIAKDSVGRLWVTHVEGGRVKINWSRSTDLDWGTPVDLPVSATATAVNGDDISAVVSFGGVSVGVMWSNQTTRSVYFARHWDTAPETTWDLETVLPNSQCPSGSCADDHISLQADSSGRVFGVVKTSLPGDSSPIIILVVRSTSGTWTDHTVNTVTDNTTRPILVIDNEHDRLYIATAAAGSIYLKTSPINSISFPTGRGQRFISSALDPDINNPTSLKQHVNGTTGLLVLASDATTRRYLHNFLPLSGGSPPTGLKNATFEGGSLTHATTGMDRVVGAVTLETAAPLKGSFAARFANVSSAYLEESFTAEDDLYVSFYIRVATVPAADARVLLLTNSGATVGNLVLRANGRVRLRNASTSLGESAVLQTGQLYRLGIRQRRGTGGDAVLEGYLATGDAEFGAPFASTSTGTWTTAANRLRLGPTTGRIDAVVDDVRLASGVMPGPSGGGTPTAPDAPSGLTAIAVSSTRVDLQWTDNADDEAGFSIERSENGGTFAEIGTPGTDATTFSDTTVTASNDYDYRVRARNAVGVSSFSNTASVTTPAGSAAPNAPSALNAMAASSTRVDLTWTDNSSDETAFHVERATGSGSFAEIAAVNANDTTYSDTSAAPGTTYDYRVRASNGQDSSAFSNTATVTTPGSSTGTSIKDITFEDGSLTAPVSGADRVVGAVQLATSAPLAGAFSARIPNLGSTYAEESFTVTGDLFLSMLVRVNALPAGDVRLLLITHAGTGVGNLVLRPSGRLRLRSASTIIGSESVLLVPGQIYRIGVRQKAGTGSNAALEAYVEPEGTAFAAPFAQTQGGTWTTGADRVRIGATTSTVADVTVDDIRLAAGAMPQP